MTEENNSLPQWEPGKKEHLIFYIMSVIFLAQVIITILYYNHLKLANILIPGWLLIVLGIYLNIRARDDIREHGKFADGTSFYHTQAVVDKGIFGIVRHPIYLGFILIDLGIVGLSQHWISAILAIPILVYLYWSMLDEEKINQKKFGASYNEYMQRVPRINALSGLIRARERKNRLGK